MENLQVKVFINNLVSNYIQDYWDYFIWDFNTNKNEVKNSNFQSLQILFFIVDVVIFVLYDRIFKNCFWI